MSYTVSDIPYPSDALGWASLAAALYVLWRLKTSRKSQHLPPGPPRLPLVGNWLSLPNPEDQPWLTYLNWSRKYNSEIVHLNVFGTDLLYVNSHEAAVELFQKKGALYADRPKMPMINDLIGFDWHFGFMPHNETWKKDRKLFSQEFNPSSSHQFRDVTVKWTNTLLKNVLESPQAFMYHIQHMASGVVAETTFGLQVQPSGTPDPFIGAAQLAVKALVKATLFGSYVVDFLPFLKYAPSWVSFKRQAKEWRVPADTAINVPLDLAKAQIAEGKATPSFASKYLESHPEDEDAIRRVGTVIFAQGSAASVSVIQTFVLEMSRNPEIQRKAQQQLDTVLEGRLPTIEDLPSLPYVSAIVKEVLRVGSTAPLAFPRRLTQDDEYKGMYLPAGSVVVPNSWAILHDESAYPEPMVFKPERFLTSDGQLNKNVREPDAAFGFGYRICPGRHFALEELFVTIASILTVFNIKNGPASGDAPYESGFLRYPRPFKATITPRSEEARLLIENSSL